MCGIAGTLDRFGATTPDGDVLAGMLAQIGHRGPDAAAIHLEPGLGLGFVRLSIVDLEGGLQPLRNEDGTLWLVCNGEIFNHVELRDQLVARGHSFRTASDCEVILHLYEEVERGFLQSLNGQFSMALWDRRRRRLLLARDRLGVRPLFWTEEGGRLHFASEMKSLFALPGVSREIDPVGLAKVFAYWSPIAPRTMFRSVAAIPPGHTLVADDAGVRLDGYWAPDFSDSPSVAAAEAPARLRALLEDAVRLRLRADVPVGAYLSGGFDSSAIARLAQRLVGGRLETFSIGFTDAGYDETAAQEQVARVLGTEHHSLTCDAADIARVLPEVVRHAETPLLRTAPAPMYLLSGLVQRSGFKVVLTGEGADEFLLGYDIYREAKVRALWARQPSSRLRPAFLRSLYADIPALARLPRAYLEAAFRPGLQTPADPGFSHRVRWAHTSRLRRLLSPELREAARSADAEVDELIGSTSTAGDPVARAQACEVGTFMEPYLLAAQGDRVAMAHAVEGRFPFLDHRLVEFANGLPSAWKAPGLREKSLLRHALADLLPEAVRLRPKRPYRAPIRGVFDAAPARDYVAGAFDAAAVAGHGLLNPTAVEALGSLLKSGAALGEVDEMGVVGVVTTSLLLEAFGSGFRPADRRLREVVQIEAQELARAV